MEKKALNKNELLMGGVGELSLKNTALTVQLFQKSIWKNHDNKAIQFVF